MLDLHREADMTKERIEKLLKAGANVVLTTKGIDDMALKYFVEAGAIAVRRVRKEDMRHVAKATGAAMVSTFADMEGEETFEPSFLGTAEEVVEERISDDAVVMIKGTKNTSAVAWTLLYTKDNFGNRIHIKKVFAWILCLACTWYRGHGLFKGIALQI
ncbi:putative T-complex protein 1, alpha subunit [Lupinus albus]|uniref:Putative T-complex protein 1, alpha subunit n=1 Tax=Lupinus albus TaxID=3870 RepID=A0A6A4Q950_LUPAL|nr:putative T-complex protein 1, alpha subunit [Lupinus albus]